MVFLADPVLVLADYNLETGGLFPFAVDHFGLVETGYDIFLDCHVVGCCPSEQQYGWLLDPNREDYFVFLGVLLPLLKDFLRADRLSSTKQRDRVVLLH